MKGKLIGKEAEETNYVSRGMAMGLAIGAGLGVALSAATDNPGLLAIGIGCGLSIGVAIGTSLQRRHEAEHSEGTGPVSGDEGMGTDGAS
jgi:hypothetical protein